VMRLLSLVVIVALMTATPWADGKGAPPPPPKTTGGSAAPFWGVQGTVTVLGTRGFAMTLDAGGKGTEGKEGAGPKTIDVICDVNTQFLVDGNRVPPSTLKVGSHVGVKGGASNLTEIMADKVNIGMPPKKGK